MSNNYEVCEQCGGRHKPHEHSEIDELGGLIPTPHRLQKFWIAGTLPGMEWVIKGGFIHPANIRKRKNELVDMVLREARHSIKYKIERAARLKIYFSLGNVDIEGLTDALSFSAFILQVLVKAGVWEDVMQVQAVEKKWGWANKDTPPGVYVEVIEF